MPIFGRKKDEQNATNKKSPVKKEGRVEIAKKESMKDLYNKTEISKINTRPEASGEINKGKGAVRGFSYRVLVKPLVTEKASILGGENKYVFAVSLKANKIEIARAIEESYGIKPTSVNIINVLGKKVQRGRSSGKRKDWKKAIITLPAGKTIQVYEGI